MVQPSKIDEPCVVADLVKLKNVVESEWDEGVEAAFGRKKVFIRPPVAGWTRAANGALRRSFFESDGKAETDVGPKDADEQHVENHPAIDDSVVSVGEGRVLQLAGR